MSKHGMIRLVVAGLLLGTVASGVSFFAVSNFHSVTECNTINNSGHGWPIKYYGTLEIVDAPSAPEICSRADMNISYRFPEGFQRVAFVADASFYAIVFFSLCVLSKLIYARRKR